MSIFLPTIHCKKVTEITDEMLKSLKIRAILLDVDNTLTSYSSKEPLKGTIEWTKQISEAGYKIYIVSNNFKARVSAISAQYGIPFVSFALKPLPIGFKQARRELKLYNKECLVVGDQIFTDILGANLGGMKSVLIDPIEIENGLTFKIRRFFESFVRPKCQSYNEDKTDNKL